MNWLGSSPEEDVYGAELIAAGVDSGTIAKWSSDPAVDFEGSVSQSVGSGAPGMHSTDPAPPVQKQSLFDLHEDLDVGECTAKAVAVLAANP